MVCKYSRKDVIRMSTKKKVHYRLRWPSYVVIGMLIGLVIIGACWLVCNRMSDWYRECDAGLGYRADYYSCLHFYKNK